MFQVNQLNGFNATVLPNLQVTYLAQGGSASTLTTYTHSSVSFGTEGSDRFLIVSTVALNVTADRTISSVTIGGVTATSIVQGTSTTGGQFTRASFFGANVPTGTSGDIVVVYSGAQVRSYYALWDVRNLQSLTPFDSASDVDTTVTLDCDMLVGGAILGTSYTNSSGTITWGGNAVQQFNAAGATATTQWAGAQYLTVAQQTGVAFSAALSAGTTPWGLAVSIR